MEEKKIPKPHRSTGGKILRIAFKTVLFLILFVTAIALLILTPPVQNFLRKKAQTFLSNKLNTKVEIGRIFIGFPKNVVLEGLYVEDLKKDTLVYGGKLKVDISMLKLLKNELEVSQVELSGLTAKVDRTLPDTVYNFQFIIDAFAGNTAPEKPDTDTASMKISVRDIILDRIRLVYNDVVTGNDMTVWLDHFDTNIRTFDLDNMNFVVPVTRISGINARIYQRKPLLVAVQEKADSLEDAAASPLQFSFDKFQLDNINLDYGNDESAMFAKLNLDKLEVNADDVDLRNQAITLKNIQLNNTKAAVRLGKTNTPATEAAAQPDDPTAAQNGWRIYVKNVAFNNNDIDFINDNEPVLKKGMDFAHLSVKGLTLHAKNFIFTPDSIAGSVTKGSLTEKSGLAIKTFETDFLYGGTEAYLKDLLLETPGTTIRRSVELRYPSISALKSDIGSLQVNLDLDNSRVQVKDILTFVPALAAQPALSNPGATFTLSGKARGSVSRLTLESFKLAGLQDTRADLYGVINGLPDAKKINGNLVIRNFQTSRRDILAIVPKGTLPANITVPSQVSLRGAVSGSMANARANLALNTNLGNLLVDGSIRNATNKTSAQYNAKLTTQNLDLGTIMQNDSLFGPVSASFVASGKGFDVKTANADLKGVISSVVLKKYNYHDIQLNGQLARQNAEFDLRIVDPNIRFALDGKADLSGEYPAIAFNAFIDSIKTQPLNLTADTLVYRGQINADFPVTDLKNLTGELLVTNSILAIPGQQYKLDTISVAAGKSDTGSFIRLNSDAVSLALTGIYNLAELGSVIQQAIQPYYAFGATNTDTISDYNFYVKGQVINGPLLKAFMPTIERLDPVTLNAHFVTGSGWQSNIDAPLAIMGTNRLEAFRLHAGTADNAIKLTTSIASFTSGTSLAVFATDINASIANNSVNFLINLNDKNDKEKYKLGGLFSQPDSGSYTFSLKPDSLMLNYDKWSIPADNIVKLNKGDVNISNFALTTGNQKLILNSSSPEQNSPLEVRFADFRIGTLIAFISQDSLLADGTINGQAEVKNILNQPVFTSDLTITDMTVRKDTIGNLALKVNNSAENVFNADVAITGKGNDVQLTGNYFVKPANQSVIDLVMDIRKLQMTSLEALSMGAITRASGFIDGRFDVKGTFDKPAVEGELNFNQAGFSPSMLGSYFTIDKESIRISGEGIRFDQFTVKDSTNNELNLDGIAATANFINYKLDLDLTADNFQALNSTKRNNQLFFGKFYFDTDLHIQGTELQPVIDGLLTVNENTQFTIVLPQQEPGVVDREGIVRFIDMDSVSMDSTILLASVDSLNKSSFIGMNVAVNIEIHKNAEFTIIVDEGSGDFLRMKGGAQLTGGIDPSGKTTLTGTYEIEEGSYDLSLNFLKRRFEIVKGSKITWLGEPTRADVDLTAIYVANTAPITLIEDRLQDERIKGTAKQKLPFEVNLIVGGEILKPEISFDIILPEDENFVITETVKTTVDARLEELRNEPSELNKQVFALLLLNRFVAENPFASSGGDGFNAGSMARQSVSKLLSEQLNNLATDLVQGVDLNFDLASTEDYTSGTMQNRTDLNVSLSKQLLNDRLKVTVGSNFELEGPQNSTQKGTNLAGNVAIDYLLSKDGRYMIRAYRKNQFEASLEGYIIETGLNFIITLDYNRFRELFHLPKEKKPRKKRVRETAPEESDTRKAGPVKIPGIN